MPALPIATPSQSTSGRPTATVVDPLVVLRVEIRPDVSVGRIPSLSVFRDGSVLRRGDLGGLMMKLTPRGVALILDPASTSELFATSGEIKVDPNHQAGFVSYAIDLRRGDELVHRSSTNASAPSDRAEADRIIALAEHLDDLEAWLPEDAWAEQPAVAVPYVPARFLLKITAFKKQQGIDYPRQALDVDRVAWPLGGRLVDFGQLQAVPPLGEGSASRCGVVTLSDATAVKQALAAAPWTEPAIPVAERMQADLDWAAARSLVSVTVTGSLPDDPPDCSIDLSWP